MFERLWTTSLTIGLLTLGACGDDAGMTPGPDAGPTPDGGPGTLTVTVLPSNGEKGVLVEQPLILSFNKPMDTATVEAAWSSTTLPAADMVFTWNTEKTILSVDASAVLEHPAGGLDVDPLGYDIVLDATAQATDGDTLAAALTSTFDTARDITVSIPATDTLAAGTGAFNTDGGSTIVLRVGDTPTNATWRAFLSFPLTSLPPAADIVKWNSASLYARQASIDGNPYDGLGTIMAGSLVITTIDAAAVTATLTNPVVFSDSAAIGNPAGDRSADVLNSVEGDHGAARTRTTFRLGFSTAQDGDNGDDAAIFETPSLDLHFLAK